MPAENPRRYFDHAATSFPKPPGVADAMHRFLTASGGSAGRGAYREAVEAGRLVQQCRAAVRRIFNANAQDAVVFTLNGTDALNLALKGLLNPGDHVVTTAYDHNSMLRPLSALEQRSGLRWTAVVGDPLTTLIDPAAIADAIRPATRLVALNHAGNVAGALQPLDEIAALCRARGVLLLVDAAQSAGHVPIDFANTPIDLLATPGHKGLLGPLGTGILLVRAGLERVLRTVREGGTGSASEQPVQPEDLPDKYESGSHNAVGLVGLLAALQWIEQNGGIAARRAHELELCDRMIAELQDCDGVRWFGPRTADQRVGVFSLVIDGFDPHELAALLEQRFGLLTRSGFHCAPLAHRALGTAAGGGATRFSCGAFQTTEDVAAAGAALRAAVQFARQLA